MIRWEHQDGWVVEHQGHGTAHNPWAAYSSEGNMLLTGGWENGTAFRHLEAAQVACELEQHKRDMEKIDG